MLLLPCYERHLEKRPPNEGHTAISQEADMPR